MKRFPVIFVICAVLGFCLAGAWDAARAQSPVVAGPLLPSAARTAVTVNSTDQSNTGAFKGAQIVVDVSARTSGTYTATIQGKDPVSGNYFPILVGPAFAGVGTTPLTVYPGITATTNSSASANLPKTWRVSIAGASTPIMTFSVGVILLP